jgi:predicted acylesterase/phospholipase RssA
MGKSRKGVKASPNRQDSKLSAVLRRLAFVFAIVAAIWTVCCIVVQIIAPSISYFADHAPVYVAQRLFDFVDRHTPILAEILARHSRLYILIVGLSLVTLYFNLSSRIERVSIIWNWLIIKPHRFAGPSIFVPFYIALLWLVVVGSYHWAIDIPLLILCALLTLTYQPISRHWVLKDHFASQNPLQGRQAVAYSFCFIAGFWLASSFLDVFRTLPPAVLQPQRFQMTSEPKLGIALSGGGYRAALMHAGVIGQLEKFGKRITNISSVSGGSIIGSFYTLGGSPESFRDILATGKLNLQKEVTDFPNLLHLVFPAHIPGTNVRLLWFHSFYRSDVQRRLLDHVLFQRRLVSGLTCTACPKLMMITTDLDSGKVLGITPDRLLAIGLPFPSQKHELINGRAVWTWGTTPALSPIVKPTVAKISATSFPGNASVAEIVSASGAFPFAFNSLEREIFVVNEPKPMHVDLVDGGLRDNSGVMMFQAASSEIEDWRVELLIASDASAVIEPLPVGVKGEAGLTRALDLMYSSNGTEGPRQNQQNTGPVTPKVLWVSPTASEGGGVRRTLAYFAFVLRKAEWYRPNEGLFSLVEDGGTSSLKKDIKACTVAIDFITKQPVCRWHDSEAQMRVSEYLLTELDHDLKVFLRTSTLNDHPQAADARSLFRLGQLLLIMRAREMDSSLIETAAAKRSRSDSK